MPVVRHADARRTTTPNATMTTHASPTLGGTTSVVTWTVEMSPGASGPEHSFDAEQVWTVLDGGAHVRLGATTHDVRPGDAVVLPAGVPRRVHAGSTGLRALVAAPAGTRATPTDGDAVVPPWVA